MNEPLLPFDELPPATRKTDPESSRLAEELVTRTGRRQAHVAIIYQVVRKHPGLTSVEIQRVCGLERHEVSRRLADLEHRHLIEKGELKTCSIKHTKMVAWFAVKGEHE